MRRHLIVFFVVALIPGPAHAATVLFDQAWAGKIGFSPTSIDGPTQQAVADDFQATGDWEITEVRWTGLYKDSVAIEPARPFRIEFFNSASIERPAEFPFLDVLVTAISTFKVDTGRINLVAWNFEATLPSPLSVPAGTILWISISDAGSNTGGAVGMFWGAVHSSDSFLFREGIVIRRAEFGPWRTNNSHGGVAYSLFGSILGAVEFDLDIKPGSCPNPLNVRSRGVLPVAILGTEELDLSIIDPSSLRLEGVAPVGIGLEDVGTSLADPQECDCTEDGPDGFQDLILRFRTQEIVQMLGTADNADVRLLTLSGTLVDGTPFEASDCVVIRIPGR